MFDSSLPAALGILLGTVLLAAATSPPTLESALKGLASTSQTVPASFEATYDDMHGLYGGLTICVRGDGTTRMESRKRGQGEPTVVQARATAAELGELVKLLVETEAWLQKTPERTPVPDESQANLRLSVEGASGGFWEWYNDMGANARLSRVRDQMTTIATP